MRRSPNDSGYYSFENLPFGIYTIKAEIFVQGRENLAINDIRMIRIGPGEPRKQFYLCPIIQGNSIVGSVSDEKGEPIEEAFVTACEYEKLGNRRYILRQSTD